MKIKTEGAKERRLVAGFPGGFLGVLARARKISTIEQAAVAALLAQRFPAIILGNNDEGR